MRNLANPVQPLTCVFNVHAVVILYISFVRFICTPCAGAEKCRAVYFRSYYPEVHCPTLLCSGAVQEVNRTKLMYIDYIL
uniref:Putative secreted protein n=1 Tax=Ixodes ricinus TaxID=34613 RepID=A0A6B0U6K3_IXORI